MSINVENNLRSEENKHLFEKKVHYMPCKIEEDGAANVQTYFEPYIVEGGSGELTGTFRGHPLDGVPLKLPEGYTAVVLTEARKPLSEDAERRFQVSGGFKEVVYWNWDKKPSKNDSFVKALDWTDIAEAVHGD